LLLQGLLSWTQTQQQKFKQPEKRAAEDDATNIDDRCSNDDCSHHEDCQNDDDVSNNQENELKEVCLHASNKPAKVKGTKT